MKCFKKYMKSKQTKWKNSKSKKKDSAKGTKCYECQGNCHFSNEYVNKKKSPKKKTINTTWDAKSSEEEKEEKKRTWAVPSKTINGKFIACIAKSMSDNYFDEDNEEDEVSDQEKDCEESYNSAFLYRVRMIKYDNKVTIKLKAAQKENFALKIE